MNYITRRTGLPGFEGFPPASLAIFEDTINRLFSEPAAARPWTPAVDIFENESDLVLKADVPGVRMEDIDIKIEDATLTVSGKREFVESGEKGAYHRIERNYGAFQRAFALPETVDTENVEAAYDHGVLTVKLPKKEIAKPKTVKVSLAKS
ncbi:MAG: Hsp20/alpha crystallin family protein [Candidatus Solibacter usitatus]|nr:Hsp20/alpha crystallin family protein [Candidatus Solibacter usitatus]